MSPMLKRRLGAMENLFWLGAKKAPGNFVFLTRLKGQFTAAQLRAALAKLRQRHPLLAVRVALDDHKKPWFTSENVPDFEILELEQTDDDHWRRVVTSELQRFFDVEVGPLIRFILLYKEDGLNFFTICQHMSADGVAAMNLIKEMLTLIADPTLEVDPLPLYPAPDRIMPIHDDLDYAPRRTSTQTRAMVVLPKIPDKRELMEIQALRPPALPNFEVLTWQIELDISLKLVKACKAEGVSVHSALVTAFLLAFMELRKAQPPYIRRFSNPVNIRPYLTEPVGFSFGLYVTPQLIMEVDCPPERSFWENVRHVFETIHSELTPENIFTPHLHMRRTAEVIIDETKPENEVDFDVAYDFALTNLGKLDLAPRYGDLVVEAQEAPFVNGFRSECILAANTFDNRIFISWAMDGAYMSLADMKWIRDASTHFLQRELSL